MPPTGRRALVADDDRVLRSFVYDVLTSDGYDVYTAADGRGALDLFLEHGPFELLVVDIVMPGMHGNQVVDLLCRSSANVRVLYISARDVIPVLGPGRRFLAKPFSAQTFRDALQGLLQS